MKNKFLLATTSVVLMATLAACGGSTEGNSASQTSGSSKLADVEYTVPNGQETAGAKFATPFVSNETQTHVVAEGSGDAIVDGDLVLLDATSYQGSDGVLLGSTLQTGAVMVPVNSDLKNSAPELYKVLTEGKVGMTFSYTSNLVQGTDASGLPTPSPLPANSATNVEIYTVGSKLLNEISGEYKQVHASLKEFSVAEDKSSTLILAEDRGEAPQELISENLIEGSGAVVGKNDDLFVRYHGARWEDGETFESSFNADMPAQFNLNQVISGWTEGLAGHKVGDRVLLIIPADQAYGDDASTGRPTGTLVFVVDILGAAPRAES